MKNVIGLIVFAVLAVLIGTCTYTLKEWDQGLVLQFGKFKRVENIWNDGADTEAGLKFKAPWENVVVMERRNIELDSKAVLILDSKKKPLEVDAFTLYEITDPEKYYKALQNPIQAESILYKLMDSSLRGVLGGVDSRQIISGRRSELMSEIKKAANLISEGKNYGVRIVDVRIKRAELPNNVAKSVFNRMISEREKEARLFRAEGDKRKNEIIATADREATIILAEAEGKAERIRGEGDGESNQIYADAYGQDQEFFSFYRSMEAYKRGLSGEGQTTYVLSPESDDFLRYLSSQKGK